MPRQIWSLWLQGEAQAPPLVRRCLDSWREHNSEWRVNVLDAGTVGQWIDPDLAGERVPSLSPQSWSNLIRLSLLGRHGGVWVDATCLCRCGLDHWLPPLVEPTGFFAFRNPGPDRPISTWFLAAEPGHPMIGKLSRQLLRYLSRSQLAPDTRRHRVLRRLEGPLARSTRRSMLWTLPPLAYTGYRPYFGFHYTFGRLAHLDPAFRRTWRATPAVPASGAGTPHSIREHGFLQPLRDDLRDELDQRRVPVYKLDWRVDPAAGPADGALRRVLEPPGRAAGGVGRTDLAPRS